jgi:outer membrane protein insertion porin family
MKAFVLILLGVSALAAQTARPVAAGNAIREIRVEGNQRMNEAEVIALSGLKEGAPAVAATFEAMRDRMLDTGCIETVGWKWEPLQGGGFKATIEVTEAQQVLPWTVDRLPLTVDDVKAAGARQLPCFGGEIPTYDRYLNRAAALVSGLAMGRGFDDEVIAKVGLVGTDQMAVIFQPKTPAPVIGDVRFVGNEAIEEVWLRRQIVEVARGVMFSESLFRQFLENQIRPMYENVGRLTVQFGKLTTAPATDVKGVVVTVEVMDGPLFTLEDVEYSGLPVDPSRIEELAEYQRDEPVNYTKIGLTIEKLFAELKSRGYLKPSYKARRKLNLEEKTARLFVDVDPGLQYRMGRLTVKGLDVVGEPVIRKMWTLQPGDPFRDDYPDFFLNAVKERGVFDFLGATKAERRINDDTRTVDVTLVFEAGAQGLDSRAVPKPKPQQ